jgi:molecular chaperone IbpA
LPCQTGGNKQLAEKEKNMNTAMELFKDPFFIGMDRELDRLMNVRGIATKQSYPPYDIIRVDEDNYLLKLAAAGFSREDLEIVVNNGTLVITGEKTEADEYKYLHKGIGMRKFTRTFALGEYMEVVSALMEDGVLHINVKREIPEEKKPKKITIK